MVSAKKKPKRKRKKAAKKPTPVNLGVEFLTYFSRKEDHLRQARNDVNAFCEYVFEHRGVGWKQGRMLREWQEDLGLHRALLIIAPRLHGKTQQVAIARSLWQLGLDVEELIKIICASDKKAVKRLGGIRTHVRENDLLHRVFPHLQESNLRDDNKHMVRFERKGRGVEPSIEALGITSSGTGDRATRLIFDDACDRRNSITLPRVRKQIIETFDDWFNLLGPDGWLWYIATLWQKEDLTHKLLANPMYKVAWYELDLHTFASYSRRPDGTEYRTDEPLWTPAEGGPWSKEALLERKQKIGERKFARGFSNQPMLDSEQRIRPEWIIYWDDEGSTEEAPVIKGPGKWTTVVAMDLASTKTKESDWTGVCVLAVRPDVVAGSPKGDLRGSVKVIDAFHDKLSFPDKARLALGLLRRYKPAALVIERAAGGIELAEFLHDKYGVEAVGIKPIGNKGARLDRVTPYIEDHGDDIETTSVVEFNPALDPEAGLRTEETGDLVSELTGFPLTDHDDILDACVHGLRYITVTYDCLEDPVRFEEGGAPTSPEFARITVI